MNNTLVFAVAALAALTTPASSQSVQIVRPSFIESAVFFITGYEVGFIPVASPNPVAVKLSERFIRTDGMFVRGAPDFEQSAGDPCVVFEKFAKGGVITWNFSFFHGSRSANLLSNGVAIIPVGDGGICSPVLSTDAKRWPSGCVKEYGFASAPAEGSVYRRLAALDYIRASFCPGLPDPPLVIKPF